MNDGGTLSMIIEIATKMTNGLYEKEIEQI
jgi:hypothetical protein